MKSLSLFLEAQFVTFCCNLGLHCNFPLNFVSFAWFCPKEFEACLRDGEQWSLFCYIEGKLIIRVMYNIDFVYSKCKMYIVSRNISPSTDISCSSGLNGSDPEQMNDKGWRPSLDVVDTWNAASIVNLCTYNQIKHANTSKLPEHNLLIHVSD